MSYYATFPPDGPSPSRTRIAIHMEPHEAVLQTGCTRPERNVARPSAVGCTFGATASAPGLAAIELVGLKMPCDPVLWSNDQHQSCAGASTIGAAMPTQQGVASTPTSACTSVRSRLPGRPAGSQHVGRLAIDAVRRVHPQSAVHALI